MAVRCGYCGDEHPSHEWVKACGQIAGDDMRRLFRRAPEPQLHPRTQAIFEATRKRELTKEPPADVDLNLAGVERARRALRPGARRAA